MIAIILTILCSTSIALILKINSNQNGDSLILLTGNYFTASLVSLLLFVFNIDATKPVELIPLGLFLSFLFVGSIFAFAKSVIFSGAALSTVSSRLSVFVPVILSIIFFGELPTYLQLIGLIFTLITIILFYCSVKNDSGENRNKSKFIYLITVLIGIGIADFFMKVFHENWSSTDKPWFLFWIFFFSFIIALLLTVKQKQIPNNKSLFLGLIMGVPNVFSSYFLISSLKSFNAVFVYPIINISIITATALLVKIFWKEGWNLFAKIALLTGLIAIAFLSV